VEDMADKLLGVRGGEPVGKHWAERFVMRSDKLDMAFSRAKDRQRILQGGSRDNWREVQAGRGDQS
jgi:hypothetical protein